MISDHHHHDGFTCINGVTAGRGRASPAGSKSEARDMIIMIRTCVPVMPPDSDSEAPISLRLHGARLGSCECLATGKSGCPARPGSRSDR
eukprot:3941727-Rhodomonas_salina.1